MPPPPHVTEHKDQADQDDQLSSQKDMPRDKAGPVWAHLGSALIFRPRLHAKFVRLREAENKHSNRKESPDSGGRPGTVAPGRTGLQESCRLPKRKRTRMAICTYNARTLASEATIEDLIMQTKKIKYDVIGLTETRRHHPLNAVYESGEELLLGTCDSRGVGGVGLLFNTSMAKNIDSFEQLTTRIGRLRMRRCGPTPA
ncbi:hypothetical protein NECAME_05842 [Necator americanus]|uniref:Endonuclease/exonuclease/phosphatase domain-containing protein n=1 Tax=Necator americanus TaxID=51031 RepID=W2TYN8_NECAM|nr:hypothetical protein NECAME_05842 [Necator americanus]ETN86754.1 hypothetical protein NECAME_05842 [Necator americanus]